jgi:predicted nuclease of restriction endonuclease-like RecB superfamily
MNQKGKNNGNYIDGRSLEIHYCSICKANPISYNNWLYGKKQCNDCYHKTLKGSGNPNFNKDNTHNNKCKDCNQHISKPSKRCKSCENKRRYINPRNNPRFGKPTPHGKHIKYKNTWMRSSWEVAYAKYLDKNGIKWLYEPKTFDLGNTTYTPDFYLPESDTYVEIKGRWRDDAKKKFKKFQKKYYSMNIILLTEKELKKLNIIK